MVVTLGKAVIFCLFSLVGYPLHSPVSPTLPLPCVKVCHQVSTGLYTLFIVLVIFAVNFGYLPRDWALFHNVTSPVMTGESIRKVLVVTGVCLAE
jgi:hypothetical protein